MVDLNFTHDKGLRLSTGIDAATVNLMPGAGVHRIAISVVVTSLGLPNELPIQVGGELWADLGTGPRWLGPVHLKQLATRSYEHTEQLMFSLSDVQLRSIEEQRQARDLHLRLHLEATLLHQVQGLYPVVQGQEPVRVPAGQWIQQLEGLGSAVALELLVPMPLDGSELRRAVQRIREAKGHITDGKYEEAVIKARLALEYVREVVPSDPKAHRVAARERTQAQRWSVLVDNLYSLASGANHDDDVTAGFTWSQADARMIVTSVAGLLGRLSNAK